MADMSVHEIRPKVSETEKITINLGLVDLGQIDLLVQEGFYSNRTDLIRTAIRNQLAKHAERSSQTIARKSLVLGLQHYSRADLEAVQQGGPDAADPGLGPGQHRRRCVAGTGARHDRVGRRFWAPCTPAPPSSARSPGASNSLENEKPP